MTSAIRAQRENEDGFTLIELLVVVIIIGILAAIAIPAFLNQRENAYTSAAESDVRNAALQVESFFTENDAYPVDGADLTAAAVGATTSANVSLDYTLDAGGQTYVITACHNLLSADGECAVSHEVAATYDSDAGGLQ